eukprot:scaffold28005_cov52-Attheya_sp.AAC.1
MSATSATVSPSVPRRSASTTRHTPLAAILRNAASPSRVTFGAPRAAENPTTHAGTNLRELRDERLNSVRSLIESQLPTVKDTIEDIAVKMIEVTTLVRKFEARLVSWNEATTENPYIPKNARVTCPFTPLLVARRRYRNYAAQKGTGGHRSTVFSEREFLHEADGSTGN